jgi:hypothetical protein
MATGYGCTIAGTNKTKRFLLGEPRHVVQHHHGGMLRPKESGVMLENLFVR